MSKKNNQENSHEFKGFLKSVELIGNRLPHPAMICVIITVAVIL